MIFRIKQSLPSSTQAVIKGYSSGKQLAKLLFTLGLIIALHSIAMVYFEKLSIIDAIWLTFTTTTTVGYGDVSAQTLEGRIATIILLYIVGIAILAQTVAIYFEYRGDIKRNILIGNWNWHMKNHIVFLNSPKEVDEEYFYKAITGMRKSSCERSRLPIVIVSEDFKAGISDRLRSLNVVHVSKSDLSKQTLESANVKNANSIVVLSRDRFDKISDSINFELVDRLREMGVQARIIVEVAQDENRMRLKKVGADSVLRPIRTYPELLVRAILAPGSEKVIETLFDSFGQECIKYELEIETKWMDIIHKLTMQDCGIPIAYEDALGAIINNPSSNRVVNARAIFVIVREGSVKKSSEIEKILKS
jgi:voltage-gated potassium channel